MITIVNNLNFLNGIQQYLYTLHVILLTLNFKKWTQVK